VSRENNTPTRREALGLTGALAAAAWLGTGAAQAASDAPLPLHTTGLEHLGLTVPDVAKSANIYGRIFDPDLYKEKDPPLRNYVKLGVGYIAIGGNATAPAKIDHVCALVENYNAAEMRKSLEDAGLKTGAVGMVPDPDGFRLQLLGTPGGLAKTTVPAGRLVEGAGIVTPVALHHIMLTVADLDATAAFYRHFFGMEAQRTKNPARVWFVIAGTLLGLEAATAGKQPGVDHFCVKVTGLDRRATPEKLKALGVEIAPSNDEGLLRFRDPDGIVVELIA
jgi:catechol 2,3-dioxygenase-like lactoylglutathione lyase family enzyme